MYSIVLMAAVGAGPTTPAADVPAPVVAAPVAVGCCGYSVGCGGYSVGCYGSCYGASYASCYGSCYGSCHGRGGFLGLRGHKSHYSCSGCSGYSCSGWSCFGCYGSCWGYVHTSAWGGCYGSYAHPITCHGGCYGGYYGGCYGAYSYPMYSSPAPAVVVPAEQPAPKPAEKVTPKPEEGASLKFQLPAAATLYVDGRPVAGEGAERAFFTPALVRGQKYFYDVRAELRVDGEVVREEKRVIVTAGADLVESFPKLIAAAAAPATVAGK